MSPEQNEPYRWYHDTVDHVPQHPRHDHVVDRCADRCDDQLPLFSQVGRGLQGDGYKVELVRDTINDTRIRGLIVDPHTGEETEEWRTDNINGGKLTYDLNYNPTTDPKTFTITFTLERPDDSQRPEGEKRGWTFTTPPIPYLWNDEIHPGVATLFTKAVSQPSNYWRERLVYPAGTGPEDYNMPRKLEPWTVNLTYGEGGDIDCPTTQEYKDHLHADLGVSKAQAAGRPNMAGDGGADTVWDWIQDASFDVLGRKGIRVITASNGDKIVETKLIAGPGIQITENADNSLTITNTMASGNWTTLRPGIDFDFMYHNDWDGGKRQPSVPPAVPGQSNGLYNGAKLNYAPTIRIIPTYDLENNLIGAQVKVLPPSGLDGDNDQKALVFYGNLKDTSDFMLRHAASYDANQKSWLFSFKFKGDYAALNGDSQNPKSVKQVLPGSNNIWNVMSPSSGDPQDPGTWLKVGASWTVNCTCVKTTGPDSTVYPYLISAVSISDGYNDQYSDPKYSINGTEVTQLNIVPWANLDITATIG